MSDNLPADLVTVGVNADGLCMLSVRLPGGAENVMLLSKPDQTQAVLTVALAARAAGKQLIVAVDGEFKDGATITLCLFDV